MKSMLTFVLKIFPIIIVLNSCTSVNELTLSVIEPAPVYIPADIKKIGIINRNLPTETTNINLDELDKFFSAEGKALDKKGADRVIMGLFDELSMYDKFEEIVIIENLDIENTGLSIFPAALSWDEIKKICYSNNIDAIISLSFYDTDTKVNYRPGKTTIENPFGKDISAPSHNLTVNTIIKSGWRIYNPIDKLINDEYIMIDKVVSKGSGINPIKSAEAIVGRNEAVMDASTSIGRNYAFRLLPSKARVTRLYYVKGSENFEKAKRMAQTGNWTGAAKLWEKEVDNPNKVIAGRACYNMAIINEINGNLEKAVEWASKAYIEYEDKYALSYLKILKYRISYQ